MSTDRPEGPLAGLARFCYRYRRFVVLAWIAGAAAVIFTGFAFAAPADNDFAGGDSGSSQAQDLIKEHFPQEKGDSLTLAIKSDRSVDDPAVRSRVEGTVAALTKAQHVVSVTSPYTGPGQISQDRKYAFATVQLDELSDDMPLPPVKQMISDARKASSDGVTFALGGPSVDKAETPGGGATEGLGVLAAVIVLLISFGSLLAMGLPIVTALFGIGTGLAVINLLGHLLPAPSFSPIVAGLIGLGVGVDYALFIVTRYREGLHDGADPEEATVTAIATAGRAVLFAGITVVVAMLGLFVMQQQLLNAVAVASSVAVLMTMFATVTLLPALLGFTGHRIDRLKLPYFGRQRTGKPLAERWAGTIQKRPVLAAVGATAVLLVLAAPALSMRLNFPNSSTQPHDTSGYASHRLIAEGFGPGFDAPLLFVGERGADLGPVAEAVRATPGVALVTPPRTSQDGGASMFVAYPKTAALDEATPRLVHRLHDDVVPRAAGGSASEVHIGGPNAASIDFADAVSSRLPVLIAVVIGLSFVLLIALVRSLAIAIKAAIMNLLSITAAYGVLTAVVQWGWLGKQLGFPTDMPVTTWVPLFMFPILFGLSMDYEVFLVSRIREEYDLGADTRVAVIRGLAKTARVITAAAAIMVTVFSTTLLGGDVAVKQIGLGLAVAIFIDATIVRMVLVPAVMELLGAFNWWLPRPLARILPSPHPVTRTPHPVTD